MNWQVMNKNQKLFSSVDDKHKYKLFCKGVRIK